MAIILVLFSFIVVLVTVWYIKYFKFEKYIKKFPGNRPLPLIGNALEITNVSEMLWIFADSHKKFGGIVKSRMGFRPPMLMLTDSKFIEFLLGSTKILEKSDHYRYLHRWLGSGLLTSGSEKWRKHRKLLTPAFHFKILEQFIDVFSTYSDILIKKLEKEVGKTSVNIYPYVTLCSLDIICATSMGTVVNAQSETESEYVYSVKEMCRIVVERITSIFKSDDRFYIFSKDCWKERRALKILHNYTTSVIASRKQEFENNLEGEEGNFDDVGVKKRRTFLDLLLQYKQENNSMSDKDIREEVDTFMFEGHDTTSSAITFILYCLANNPEVQEKVIDELATIFSDDKSRTATHRDLQDMKYIELVIKESLRLYPPVPIIARHVHEDVEYDGTILPKDLNLSIFVFGLHRCPKTYPDPEKFDPERFTPENQSKRSPYAYIPFSAGPRNCIGQKFAMLEMKSVVSKVVRNFELLPSVPQHTPQLVGETILKSKNGVRISLRKRNF